MSTKTDFMRKDSMSDHAAHLQTILEAATAAAKASPTAGNISAVERARKAIDDYRAARSERGEKYATQAAALEYLQRTWQIEKSKLSKDVRDGRVPRKDGHFYASDLDFYAESMRLKSRTIELQPVLDGSDRLKAAMAEEREIRVAQLKGQLIDAAEEEARDARLWFAVRSDIENHAPAVVNELVNRVVGIGLPDDVQQRILALAPELRAAYEDALADIFDRYARDGGVEA